jgi:hypothetical protein
VNGVDVQQDLGLLVVGVEFGDGAEGGDAGVVTEDLDLASGELGGKDLDLGRVGQVDRADLDRDPMGGPQFAGELFEELTATGDEDYRVATGGQRPGELATDTGGGPGDDGAGVF